METGKSGSCSHPSRPGRDPETARGGGGGAGAGREPALEAGRGGGGGGGGAGRRRGGAAADCPTHCPAQRAPEGGTAQTRPRGRGAGVCVADCWGRKASPGRVHPSCDCVNGALPEGAKFPSSCVVVNHLRPGLQRRKLNLGLYNLPGGQGLEGPVFKGGVKTGRY